MSLQLILQTLETRGEALFTLFLGCPFLLPIPLPGLSIPFGILIAIFGLTMASGWKLWLPQSFLQKPLPPALVQRFCRGAVALLLRLERFIKARYAWVYRSPLFKTAAGVMITICGILLALPLPPGTNFPPAMVIVTLSIAILEGDGLLLLVGYGLFVLNLVFFALLSFLGYEALIHWFRVG